jgi:hypothetical protein
MDTPIKWNASGSRQVAIARPKWEEMRQGLLLAIAGHAVLFFLGIPGLVFLGPHGDTVITRIGLAAEDAQPVGLTLTGTAALLGYGLVVLGQWRCLICAPQGNGAKELLFACLLCSLLAPVFPALAHLLGGAGNYPALLRGPAGLPDLQFLKGAGLVQLIGALLALASVLLFSAFARAAERYLGDTSRAHGVVCFFLFVLFLLGGTAGVFMHARHRVPPGVWTCVGVGWLLCLFWHTVVLHGASQSMVRFLRQRRSRILPITTQGETVEPGQVVLTTAAHLNRDW